MNTRVHVGDDSTSLVYEPALTGTDAALFVCAHGAGGSMSDKAMLASANAMRAAGIGVLRFNFIYKEKKSGRPDAMPKLKATIVAVVAEIQRTMLPKKLIIGGRSMGGRAASMLAADHFQGADGLLLLAYPLHPAGHPEKLRDAHLPLIRMPVCAFSGTRDPLCTRELMEVALKPVKTRWDMHWVEGADHSFHVLKSSGTTDAQVMTNIADESRRWVDSL